MAVKKGCIGLLRLEWVGGLGVTRGLGGRALSPFYNGDLMSTSANVLCCIGTCSLPGVRDGVGGCEY